MLLVFPPHAYADVPMPILTDLTVQETQAAGAKLANTDARWGCDPVHII